MRLTRHVLRVLAVVCVTWSCAEVGTNGAGGAPRVELLTVACESGDVVACDELAVEPAASTDERSFGATCGGRREVPAGSCRDLLGSTTTQVSAVEPGCLALGARGDGVRDLQQRLNAAGAEPPLVVDGEFGPRTEAAVVDLVGTPTFCDDDSLEMQQEQAAYVTVPDVRRLESSGALAQVEAAGLVAASSTRCSDVVDLGTVVAVQYSREDGRTLTIFDAEVPVNSETLLVPPERAIDLVVSSGSCSATAPTATTSP